MPRKKQHCPQRMKWEGGVRENNSEEAIAGEESSEEEEEEDKEEMLGPEVQEKRDNSTSPQPPPSPPAPTPPPPQPLPLVHHAPTPTPIPPAPPQIPPLPSPTPEPIRTPLGLQTSSSSPEVLDFSTKGRKRVHKSIGNQEQDSGAESDQDSGPEGVLNLSKPSPTLDSSPLDLSTRRKRTSAPVVPPTSPLASLTGFVAPKQWVQYKAPVTSTPWAVNQYNPVKEQWNGVVSEATKALEKMSELSKLGEASAPTVAPPDVTRHQQHGRQSAWQSHWLSKSAEQSRDVLKCVWCRQSFQTLSALTVHMKEAKHCSTAHFEAQNAPKVLGQGPNTCPPVGSISVGVQNSIPGPSIPSGAVKDLIKESMPLPRKLVRGQDVWLGKGAEQTRQILKCMWCGQSFRSLAEMTSHMQQTQHYTNIVSQEQIISWKSADERGGGGGGGASGPAGGPGVGGGAGSNQGHVTAVLTCKVCDEAFGSLKELSNHMVKNQHYKDHVTRIQDGTANTNTPNPHKRRTSGPAILVREKRKKSLPVRKLLELERAQNGGEAKMAPAGGKISCEKCGERIEAAIFVDHVRVCAMANQNLLKTALLTENQDGPGLTPPGKAPGGTQSTPSVLNAIEKLIEKSFDSRRHLTGPAPTGNPVGASILKRLGIDEGIDYTKPLVDHVTLLRYQALNSIGPGFVPQQPMGRERSGSESSSISGSGTPPERKPTPIPEAPPEEPQKEEEETKEQAEEQQQQVVEVKEEKETVETAPQEDQDKDQQSPPPEAPTTPERPQTPEKPSETPEAPKDQQEDTTKAEESSETPPKGSISALTTMFDTLSGAETTPNSSAPSSHPLAALQKLCDKTETRDVHVTRSPSVSSSNGTSPNTILAFSWSVGDGGVTSEQVKGAYRHHLAKMEAGPSQEGPQGPRTEVTSPKAPNPSPGTPPGAEESPHSKFLKYTELAKQLSSKYV